MSQKDRIESLGDKLDEMRRNVNKEFNTVEYGDKSRFHITEQFLRLFFGSILFVFVFCGLYNAFLAGRNTVPPLDLINVMSVVTTTLGPPLGFVMGYYFKDKR